MDEMHEEEIDIVTLVDEDGNEADYEVLARIEEDGAVYVALVEEGLLDSLDDEDDPVAEYIILKYALDENGEEILVTIDDEDEFDRISDMFDDELSSYDYDEEV